MIWLHGVSVGESLANITLAKALLKKYPDQKILMTSTTKTSEALIKKHISENITYEKYPLDFPWKVSAFLNKHKPKLAIFGESELWPFMLGILRKRSIPAALINARLSEKSYQRWKLAPFLIKPMLKTFSIVLGQSSEETQRYKNLGAENAYTTGNLKFASEPLSYDAAALKTLHNQIKDRAVLLFASTHAPEEEIAAQIHFKLKERYPDLLSIIVPRHPERGDQICIQLRPSAKLSQRSKKETIEPDIDIYLADTLGELGLFYKLCPIAFLGNSLTTQPGGGHNPIEPAHLDCAILYGPHMFNFALIDQEMKNAKAILQSQTPEDLIKDIKLCIENPETTKQMIKNAKAYARSKQNVLDDILAKLAPVIDTALYEST